MAALRAELVTLTEAALDAATEQVLILAGVASPPAPAQPLALRSRP